MQPSLSLVLFSRHPEVLQSLVALLERAGVQVLAATQDLGQLKDDILTHAPRVVVIDDFRMPDLSNSLEHLRDIPEDATLVILRSAISSTFDPLPGQSHYLVLEKPVRGRDLIAHLRSL
jgi:DNA-binding response OmpR family regulator